jgi:hypothetical protein
MKPSPVIADAIKVFLGEDFTMGSVGADRILPTGPGQEPHIDYPYCDFHHPASFPTGINSSFPLNAQVTIHLNPFTARSGATAFISGSQKELGYPEESDRFFERCDRMAADPGDATLGLASTYHCSKFVKPLEDFRGDEQSVVPASGTQPDHTGTALRPAFVCRHCGAPMIVVDILERSAQSADRLRSEAKRERNGTGPSIPNVAFAATRATSGRLRLLHRAASSTAA